MEGNNAVESLPFVISFLMVLPRDDTLNPFILAIYCSVLEAFELQKVGGWASKSYSCQFTRNNLRALINLHGSFPVHSTLLTVFGTHLFLGHVILQILSPLLLLLENSSLTHFSGQNIKGPKKKGHATARGENTLSLCLLSPIQMLTEMKEKQLQEKKPSEIQCRPPQESFPDKTIQRPHAKSGKVPFPPQCL